MNQQTIPEIEIIRKPFQIKTPAELINFPPIIYDTTLREGMQTPGGIGGSIEETICAAHHIARYANWVELGMPANDVDYALIRAVQESFMFHNRDCGIAVLCRNQEYDIDRAVEVFGDYKNTLAHLFIGTSSEHRKVRFKGNWNDDAYLSNIHDSVAYAASKSFSRIMFSPEDAFRTFEKEPELFFAFVDAACAGYYSKRQQHYESGERLIINFPDTVGKSTVLEHTAMLQQINERYCNLIETSVHCHNDSGSADQATVAAYMTGLANVLQTTFFNLGERSGIASTENVIAVLESRGYLNAKSLGASALAELVPRAKSIAYALGRTIPAEAPITGDRTNVSTAGIHTQLVNVNADCYHIHGSKYGAIPVIEFGRTSGSEQILPILSRLGIEKPKTELTNFTNQMKSKCNDDKRVLSATDIVYHALHYFEQVIDPLQVSSFSMTLDSDHPSTVCVRGKYQGKDFSEQAIGNSIESIVHALNSVINHGGRISLVDFVPKVIPTIPDVYLSWHIGEFPPIVTGLDIESELGVSTVIRDTAQNDEFFYGYAAHTDSFKAMANSVIDAVVKMMTIRDWEEKMNL